MYNNIDIYVAAGPRFSRTCFFTPESLAELFNGYNKGKEGFIEFCEDKRPYRAPNTSLVRFNYCPITGIKIDWELVLEEGLKYFKD